MSEVRHPNHSDATRRPEFFSGHEGVAFVATLRGTAGRDVLDTALDALRNLHHACSRASGILTHIPDRLLRHEFGPDLPPRGQYALGTVFHADAGAEEEIITKVAAEEGFAVLTWREVPLNDTIVEIGARATMPAVRQVILVPQRAFTPQETDASLYRVRKRAEALSGAYFASLSRTTIVYKGLVPAPRLALLYLDLANPLYRTEIAIVHSSAAGDHERWADAQPHRILAHDGQIHSARANEAWFRARVPLMTSGLLAGIDRVVPEGLRAEGYLDEFVDLLHRGGRPLTQALRMAVPEQWGHRMTDAERGFYDYCASVCEPWEGSGVTCFADGYLVGAVLDRHGTRGGRYWVTETGTVVFASETGVVDLDPSTITKKGRLAPGELIAVDTVIGNILPSDAVRAQLASIHPYRRWVGENLREFPPAAADPAQSSAPVAEAPAGAAPDPSYQLTPGALRAVDELAGGRATGAVVEPTRHITFFDRFRSRRSLLTTPYIDAVAMPAHPGIYLGPESNLLEDGPQHVHKVRLPGPALASADLRTLEGHFATARINGVYERGASDGLESGLERILHEVDLALGGGAELLILSNRGARSGTSVPIPSLLTTGLVHEHLLERGERARVSIVVEAGDAVEPIHLVRLIEAGAEAVSPYHGELLAGESRAGAYLRGLDSAVFATLLANGVAEYGAFQGSRGFHIIGLAPALVDTAFTGAARALGTLGLAELAERLTEPEATLDPLHQLLTPKMADAPPAGNVESAEEILERFITDDGLVVTDERAGVDLVALATARDVLLTPPAHHDTIGPNGLVAVIEEMRQVNPAVRVHVRVGADLTSDLAALEARAAGADVINLVDGEYEWVFGLLSLRQSRALAGTTIAVGTPLRSGREVLIAAMLGAQEYRIHHGAQPLEIARELRELLGRAGALTLEEVIGRAGMLDWGRAAEQWRSAGVELAGIRPRETQYDLPAPRDMVESLDSVLVGLTDEALQRGEPARINSFITNTDASVGARLAGEVARRFGRRGLAKDTIRLTLTGSSGASLGAYAAPGMTLKVQGEAGDLVGKGLSGGRIIVRPETTAGFSPQENIIAGSAIGYGATAGQIYLAGGVGERLGAHNWGATIVSEGAGNAAGYRMHGGTLVILGAVGTNLGAGLDGGVIYVLDLDHARLHSGGAYGVTVTQELTESDMRLLTAIMAEHVEGTQSRIATMLLNDPDAIRARFTKIHRQGQESTG